MQVDLGKIDELLSLLAVVCEPGFEVCIWEKSMKREIDGKTVHTMPYPTYSPLVDTVFETVFGSCDPADPYVTFPEDPPGVEPARVISTPADMAQASLTQVIRYLMICRRGERFSEGHIEQAFTSGMIAAAAERLKFLRTSA